MLSCTMICKFHRKGSRFVTYTQLSMNMQRDSSPLQKLTLVIHEYAESLQLSIMFSGIQPSSIEACHEEGKLPRFLASLRQCQVNTGHLELAPEPKCIAPSIIEGLGFFMFCPGTFVMFPSIMFWNATGRNFLKFTHHDFRYCRACRY